MTMTLQKTNKAPPLVLLCSEWRGTTLKTCHFKTVHSKITKLGWDPPYIKKIEWQKVDGRGYPPSFLSTLKGCLLKVLSLLEASNHGQENYWKSGVQIPAGRSKIFCSFFFSFSNSLHKSGYLLFYPLFDILFN